MNDTGTKEKKRGGGIKPGVGFFLQRREKSESTGKRKPTFAEEN